MLSVRSALLVLVTVGFGTSGCDPIGPGGIKIIDRDGDGFQEGPDDCNDGDPNIHVDAVEICDGIDNDCDELTDEADDSLDPASMTAFYTDADSDGHADPAAEVLACTAPAGTLPFELADDCDDTDAQVSPEASEVCDDVDNDCDGDIDDDDAGVTGGTRWFRDDDHDGFGDALEFVDACDAPSGFVDNSEDCDDGDDARHPDAIEVCDDIDNDCDSLIDDDDSSLDASSRTDFYADDDGDGYGDPDDIRPACEVSEGVVDNTADCNDDNPDIHPDAQEVCDDADNDCDGDIDDADTSVDTSTGTEFYADRDSDGEGDAFTTVWACDQPSAYVLDDSDCDDADATRHSRTAWYPDADSDSYGDDSATATLQCLTPGSGYVLNNLDCDDAESTSNPGSTETCDAVDNDCDGVVDNGVTDTFYADADSDSYGDPASTVDACDQPSGYVDNSEDCDDTDDTLHPDTVWYLDADSDGYGGTSTATQCTAPTSAYLRVDGDCDDGDATSNPGATEVCDGADNNCDGDTDEGVTTTYYLDSDADGHGVSTSTTEDCSVPTGYAEDADDCDDTDSAVNPDATEVCNDVDDDCDGDIDDADTSLDTTTATTWYADADTDGEGDSATTALTCDVPSGYVSNADDCDDTDATLFSGTVWYLDADSDGFGDDTSTVTQCSQPTAAYVLDGGDCDTTDSSIYPGAAEVCDGVDDDCDGVADNGVTTDYYPDLDGDGFGDGAETPVADCSAPSGYVTDDTDCDDTSEVVYPGATELCDDVQNDCDDTTWTDDAGLVSLYDDATAAWYDATSTWAAGTSSAPAAYSVIGDGTLNVCEGTWYVSVDVQADLDLVGIGGESAVILDGAGSVTPFAMATPGVAATVEGLTMQNGQANVTNGSWPSHWPSTIVLGGNVYCEGSLLALTDVTLASGNADNGGNFFSTECDVDFDGVTVTGGTASYNGGVTFFEGTNTVANSTFDSNSATYDGGGLSLGGPTGDHTVTDSTFSNNSGVNGAGLRILDSPANTISGCTFEDNTASGYGAAMYAANYTHDPVVDVDTTTFDGNSTTGSGSASMHMVDGELTVDTCDFESNVSNGGPAGIYAGPGTDSIIADSTFTSNTGDYGAAVGAYGDTMDLSGSTFTSNHASTIAGSINVQGGHLELSNTDFIANTAGNSNGGVRFNHSPTSGTIDGCLFEGNEGLNSTSNGGGAALVLRYGVTVDITNTDFIDNVASLTSGSMYGGGAIWSYTSSSYSNNSLTMYSVTATGNESAQSGGFMYGRLTDITMGNVVIDSNTANGTVGGAFNLSASSISMSNSDITNNSAATDGGGIYTSSSANITATSCDIYGNSPDDTYISSAGDSDIWGVNSSFTCTSSGGCN